MYPFCHCSKIWSSFPLPHGILSTSGWLYTHAKAQMVAWEQVSQQSCTTMPRCTSAAQLVRKEAGLGFSDTSPSVPLIPFLPNSRRYLNMMSLFVFLRLNLNCLSGTRAGGVPPSCSSSSSSSLPCSTPVRFSPEPVAGWTRHRKECFQARWFLFSKLGRNVEVIPTGGAPTP